MANKACIHAVDALLRLLCATDKPFGGKPFIGVGDFRQVAPVVRGGGLAAVIDASIRSSALWPCFSLRKLEQPMRNVADLEYCNYVDSIGEDINQTRNIQLQYLKRINSVKEALQWLYPQSVLEDPLLCIQRSFLATLNARVDELNGIVLQSLQGPTSKCVITLLRRPSTSILIIHLSIIEVYFSYDVVKEDSEHPIQLHGDVLQDYLGMLFEPGIPPHQLELKVGAICTIQRNLSTEKGLVKNARVIICQLNRHSIKVAVLPRPNTTLKDLQEYPLSKINFEFNPNRSSWTVLRKQFPLRLAYATTFNSSQGLTLDRMVIDLRQGVFAHGQLYTALSRIRHRDHGRALFSPTNLLGQTTNVVSRELLLQ